MKVRAVHFLAWQHSPRKRGKPYILAPLGLGLCKLSWHYCSGPSVVYIPGLLAAPRERGKPYALALHVGPEGPANFLGITFARPPLAQFVAPSYVCT